MKKRKPKDGENLVTSADLKDVFSKRLNVIVDEVKENAKKECEKARITGEQLAENTGVARTSFKGYLDGTQLPDVETLVNIANKFNVSIDYLLGRQEVKQLDLNTQACCQFTGLSEDAVSRLHNAVEELEFMKSITAPNDKESKMEKTDRFYIASDEIEDKARILESILIFISVLLESEELDRIASIACIDSSDAKEVLASRHCNFLLFERVYDRIFKIIEKGRINGKHIGTSSEVIAGYLEEYARKHYSIEISNKEI